MKTAQETTILAKVQFDFAFILMMPICFVLMKIWAILS